MQKEMVFLIFKCMLSIEWGHVPRVNKMFTDYAACDLQGKCSLILRVSCRLIHRLLNYLAFMSFSQCLLQNNYILIGVGDENMK